MLIAEVNSTGYNIVLLLHILTAIVGLGGVMLNGVYGATAKSMGGSDALAISKAVQKTSGVAEKIIYFIPIFGIGLIMMSDEVWEFSQTWISIAFVLYFIALGLAHGVLKPSMKKMIALGEDLKANPPTGGGPPPQVAQMMALGKRMGMAGSINSLLLIALLYLMIWKPGL